MNRRYCFGIASVLYFLCFITACGLLANAFGIMNFSHSVKIISDAGLVLSGYAASFFYCLYLGGKKACRFMKKFLYFLFGFYILMLVDFTLIDDGFGRNIFNFLSWNKGAFREYINESTNLVPFATVKLFINGYFNDKLSFGDTVINLFGNFLAFMPLPLFVCMFFKKFKSGLKIFIIVLISVIAIELLQFLFLTGSSDIDDVILNTSGAMLFYYFINEKRISKGISKLTFGVWNNEECKN